MEYQANMGHTLIININGELREFSVIGVFNTCEFDSENEYDYIAVAEVTDDTDEYPPTLFFRYDEDNGDPILYEILDDCEKRTVEDCFLELMNDFLENDSLDDDESD
jgi:hypothetical protein